MVFVWKDKSEGANLFSHGRAFHSLGAVTKKALSGISRNVCEGDGTERRGSPGLGSSLPMPLCSQKSLRASRTDPKIKTSDVGKLARYHTLHLAFWALHLFRNEMQRLPKPRDQVSLSCLLFCFQASQTLLTGCSQHVSYSTCSCPSPEKVIGFLTKQFLWYPQPGPFPNLTPQLFLGRPMQTRWWNWHRPYPWVRSPCRGI